MTKSLFNEVQITKFTPRMYGGALWVARKKRRIGLRKLAKRAGISPSYLSKIENGQIKFVSKKVVKAIEEALGA